MRKLFLTLALLASGGTLMAGEFTVDGGLAGRGAPGYILEASVDGKAKIFPGATVGFWNHNGQPLAFADIHIGARVPIGPVFLQGVFGVAGLTRTTDNLGTYQQFRSSIFVGWKTGKTRVRCGFTHFSNASRLFGWSGPNRGENFLTCGLGIPLN